ncbi:hypothetical protein J7J08_10815 [Stenotrophomonas sp. ISL-67]|uniref:hypothetical protein n=1 Tax=Stenotrophomonas sp. ISL-67 TaxID=2819171 RepID=UPI001BE87BED|nr:hypothetical protein [Stenotrophomonas sp. ISL-67]MBT2768128.1 hypothetical protein [Stenotrophomonas sp. ISL-67]
MITVPVLHPAGVLLRRFIVPIVAVMLCLPFLQSAAQAQFLLLLAVSFTGMVWLGDLCARWWRLEVMLASPALFGRALLGQFVLFVVWLCATPITWTWTHLAGLPHALSILILGVVLSSVVWQRRRVCRWLRSSPGPGAAWLALFVLAFVALAKAATHYSFTAGALGLDTHQHIAFTLDLFNAGYPKLSAGQTDWLEKYPKMLHTLAALWAWPGFGAHIGPFVKIQPVLQATLAVFAFMELVLLWLERRQLAPILQQAWAALLVVALGYMIVRGTTFLYPVEDLNSTGRLAAFSTLLLPVWLAMHAWLEPAAARRPWVLAWLGLAFAGALAAKLNPSLAISFTSFTVPAWLIAVSMLWWRAPGIRGKVVLPLLGLCLGGVLGIVVLLCDPYYLHLLAEALPSVRHVVEHSLGLNLLAPSEVMPHAGPTWERMKVVLWWELWYGPQPGVGFQYLPKSLQVMGQWLLPFMRAAVAVSFVVCVGMLTVAPASVRQERRFGMLLAVQLGLVIGVAAALRMSNIVQLSLGHETLEASLLSTYTGRYVGLLSMYAMFLQVALALSVLLLAIDSLLACLRPEWHRRRWLQWAALTVLGVSVLGVVIGFVRQDIKGVTPADQGWTFPISEEGVRAFQAAERQLPEDAVVLAPAYAIVLNGREDWVLPSMYVTPYLPFAQRDYLFNVRIGSGYGYQAKDLRDLFCRWQPEETRAFLRRAGVTHLLAHRWEGQSDARVLDGQYCLTGYRQLGAVGEAVATGPDGLVFYQLHP